MNLDNTRERQTDTSRLSAHLAAPVNPVRGSRAQQWACIQASPRKRHQLGGILDEYGFYLLLAALTLVAILVVFSHNSVDTQVQQMTTELNTVMGKVKTTYRGQYDKVSVPALIDNGVFRDLTTLSDTGGTITIQPGGGTLLVEAGSLRNSNDAIQYTVPGQPDAACPALVAAFKSSAGRIVVNGATVKEVGGAADPSLVKCAGDDNTVELFIS
ncbi:pilus assembly protein PilS [Cupriavidus pauculus]|uniref:pilus assembly protein PilS n=1 Tax=Cupriavidus pauculus TaxID=82633 RepID=UPI001EE2A4B8|nr:pilus assembly protein PilS [Cupriavidus pauculus]GJG97749.1 type IV prepilin protein PilS [Cupriavidus pauculus]